MGLTAASLKEGESHFIFILFIVFHFKNIFYLLREEHACLPSSPSQR